MEATKEPTLAALSRVLDEAGFAWALIGGVAVQIHRTEPRTTLDVDVAVLDRAALPVVELERAGFHRTGSFEHSENWESADGVPVQFTDDPAIRTAVGAALRVTVGGLSLRVLAPLDLVKEKLRAAGDPARRRSKRLQDLADANALVEDHPRLRESLSSEEARALDATAGRLG